MDTANSPTLLMFEVGVTAHAKDVDRSFVVLKGSTARRNGEWVGLHTTSAEA